MTTDTEIRKALGDFGAANFRMFEQVIAGAKSDRIKMKHVCDGSSEARSYGDIGRVSHVLGSFLTRFKEYEEDTTTKFLPLDSHILQNGLNLSHAKILKIPSYAI